MKINTLRQIRVCGRLHWSLLAEARDFRRFQAAARFVRPIMSARSQKPGESVKAVDALAMNSRAAAVGENRRAFPIAAFCNRYGIGRSKTYEEINAGRLIAVKSGHRTLIREEDAERWLRSLPMIPSAGEADSAVVASDLLPKVARQNGARNMTPRAVIYRKNGTR
jgi:excisionase family DNA binding protein